MDFLFWSVVKNQFNMRNCWDSSTSIFQSRYSSKWLWLIPHNGIYPPWSMIEHFLWREGSMFYFLCRSGLSGQNIFWFLLYLCFYIVIHSHLNLLMVDVHLWIGLISKKLIVGFPLISCFGQSWQQSALRMWRRICMNILFSLKSLWIWTELFKNILGRTYNYYLNLSWLFHQIQRDM